MRNEHLLVNCTKLSEKRLPIVRKTIENWMRSDALMGLVGEFGGDIPNSIGLLELSEWMVDFSKVWDYREKQKEAFDEKTNEKARWLLSDDESWSNYKKNMIINSSRSLGFIDTLPPKENYYDYFFVLGGANLSCLLRSQYASELVYRNHLNPKKIVLLTTNREVSESEKNATDTYAPDAVTEFGLMTSGASKAFKFGEVLKDVKYDDANRNKEWRIVEYSKNSLSPEVLVLSAPSSDPEIRRANSVDSYNFFFEKYQVEKGSKLLLITSQIYVPYQHMEALRTLAFNFDVEIETIGIPNQRNESIKDTRSSVHYLQEIRANIISINKFLKKYH